MENTEFITTIRALAHGGAGVGSIEKSSEREDLTGKTCFVPYSIPGEKIEAKIEIDSKNFVEGSILQILENSPDRILPPCPSFGSCGGCDLQHLNLEAQRKFKVEMVQGYLEKHAGIEDSTIAQLYSSDLQGFAYRKRVIFHLNRDGQVGFYHKKTKRILEIENCLIALPEINQALQLLKNNLSDFGGIVEDIVVEYIDKELFVELKLRPKLRDGKENYFADVLGKLLAPVFENLIITFCAIPLFVSRNSCQIKAEELEFPVGHFSQVNEQGNKILQDLVVEFCAGQDQITELYAGAGNFTFPLARMASKVIAVEADRALVKYGESLARKLGLADRIEFVRKSCEKYVRKYPMLPCVVLDPPRCGAIEAAERMDPAVTKRIVYVSCALPTLCRDIKILQDKGYKLIRTLVVDMFPQTHHVETVSVLQQNPD